LLQLRAPWVHNGGTWGIPGGARDSHESWAEAAVREAIEEVGISPNSFTHLREYVDDHLSWSYVTVIAEAAEDLTPGELNHETMEVRWVAMDEVESLPLHQSFAKSWRSIRPLLLNRS
jgi:8-oxo-dGTP pyrophosphatase MutT (NUDIX family)